MDDAGKKYNDELIARLIAYQANEGGKPITDEAVGRAIGKSGSTIGRYKRQDYGGDVAGVEGRLIDMLAAAEVRDIDRPKPVRHALATTVRAYFESIKRVRKIAVMSGDAGVGKTIAVGLYAAEFLNSIPVVISNWSRDERPLMREIYEQGRLPGWTRRGSLGAHVAKTLKKSDRLLIIDNAHKLSSRALGAMFDLNDVAQIPIALVGNPEIEDRIAANDQWHSRVGPHKILELSEADALKVAQRLLAFYAPDAPDKLKQIATATMQSKGHGRRLETRLQMAKRLREGDASYTWPEAFDEAGEEMVELTEEAS